MVAALYVLLVYAGAVVVTGSIGDWWPASPVGAGLRLAGAVVVVAALALLGSIFLSATANGIAALMVFGAGLLAGLLGSIGDALNAETLQAIANTASWVLPFEALYRDALRVLVAEVAGRHRGDRPARPAGRIARRGRAAVAVHRRLPRGSSARWPRSPSAAATCERAREIAPGHPWPGSPAPWGE